MVFCLIENPVTPVPSESGVLYFVPGKTQLVNCMILRAVEKMIYPKFNSGKMLKDHFFKTFEPLNSFLYRNHLFFCKADTFSINFSNQPNR